MTNPGPVQRLIKSLSGLPGIGEKTATRLALHIMNCRMDDAIELSNSIKEVRERVTLCSLCYNFTETDPCSICSNTRRMRDVVCVVETPGDILSIEKTGWFHGLYHVLHGVISPLDGIGPDQIRIRELEERTKRENIKEIILATNPTMNGNATAVYICDRLKASGITITRIAQGIPTGGDIGYADQVTLRNALDGRREMK